MAHHVVALHSAAVVGKGYGILPESFHVYELAPLAVDRDRGIGIDIDCRVFLYDVEFLPDVLHSVGSGVEVRHGAYGGISSHHRRGRSGEDRLLRFKARLAQMHVYVAESVADESAVHIEGLGARIVCGYAASAFYPDCLIVDNLDGCSFVVSFAVYPAAVGEHIVARHPV